MLSSSKNLTSIPIISIISLSFLHQTKKKNDAASHQSKGLESKHILEKKISNSNPRAPPYSKVEEESKHSLFKSPIFEKSAHIISKKVGPHPEVLGQPNMQDTNHPCHTISVIIVPEFKKMSVTDFMSI